MLSPKAKRNILRILPFPMMWFIFGSVYAVVEKGILGDLGHYPSTGNPYDFSSSIYIVPMSAFVAGLFIGSCEILYLNKWFIHQTFARKIVFKSMIYLVLIISFLIITT